MPSYITDQIRAELADHRLTQVCNAGGVRVFRMAKPGTTNLSVDLVFLPSPPHCTNGQRILITWDIMFGSCERGATSATGYGLGFFSGSPSEQHLCEAFLPQVWVPALGREALSSALRDLQQEDPEDPEDRAIWHAAIGAIATVVADGGAIESYDDFYQFWCKHVDVGGPERVGMGHVPQDAGWLAAIQQRFTALWVERMARIEAIVAGWEWSPVDLNSMPASRLMEPNGESRAAATSDEWMVWNPAAGKWVYGKADDIDAAKDLARAAVLRQAKEHPVLWHCGEVEG